MIIYNSKISQKGTVSVIETVFETKGVEQTLWYKLPSVYNDYIVTENLDAPVVALLVLAMLNNEDIYVKGQLSARLNYTLNNYLIKALNYSNPDFNEIKIIPDAINYENINIEKSAATGLSCGIDSISTITSHLNLKKNYKLNYLTYFNAGSHGFFGGEKSNQIYYKRLANIELFAKDIGLPLVKIDTNLLDVLNVSFQSIHSIIHASCVLNLQKMFNTYYYASAFRFDYFKFDKNDTSSWDTLILNMLSTESTSFFSSMSQYSRFERTKLISNNNISYKYLDVCTNTLNATKLNCSKCEKCLRTLLSLEMIGKLNEYNEIFDLQLYKSKRDNYIGALINKKDYNQINEEIYLNLKQRSLIKTKHYLISMKENINQNIKKFKSILKPVIKK